MTVRALAPMLLACAAAAHAAGGSFELKIFQGFRFSDQKIVESGAADLSFFYQTRGRFGMISFLGAPKIQRFDTEAEAAAVRPAQVAAWDDSVAGPSPGWYVVRAKDGAMYTVHLRAFENQGRAASYWLMRFDWASFGARPTAPSATAPASDLPAPIGRDGMAALEDKVVVSCSVVTRLKVGPRGDVYGVAIYRAGTKARIENNLFQIPGEPVRLTVRPGRYDVWVLSGDDRMKLARTVDLSNVKPGSVIPLSLAVESFDTRVQDMR